MLHHSPSSHFSSLFFFFNDTATTEIYTLSLHDALPISGAPYQIESEPSEIIPPTSHLSGGRGAKRSEEHTSELQSRRDLVCRLLLEKKKKKKKKNKNSQTKKINYTTSPHDTAKYH